MLAAKQLYFDYLDLRGLAVSEDPLINNFTQDFKAGNIYWLQGKNGSGKSTLLKLFAGFLKPNTGSINAQAKILYLPEAPILTSDLTILENLLSYNLFVNNKLKPKSELLEILEYWELDHKINNITKNISRGQKQRLYLSNLNLALDKSIWLLDEPYLGLDNIGCLKLNNILNRHIGNKKLVIITSHNYYICENDNVIKITI